VEVCVCVPVVVGVPRVGVEVGLEAVGVEDGDSVRVRLGVGDGGG
jgi:hypothetical protein